MNRGFNIASIVLGGLLVVGCGNKGSNVPSNSGVTDVTSPPAPVFTPSPAPVAPQPVTYDTMPPTGGVSGGSVSAGSYTVKKGDTLYSIARNRYGDGKQWQRIAAANPGLRPESLKVGQTITIP